MQIPILPCKWHELELSNRSRQRREAETLAAIDKHICGLRSAVEGAITFGVASQCPRVRRINSNVIPHGPQSCAVEISADGLEATVYIGHWPACLVEE